jgi:hypothetical protein
MLSIAAGLVASSGLAADLATSGRLDLDAGQLASPLGLSTDDPAPYAHGSLMYEVALAGDKGRTEVTYLGTLTRFDQSAALGHARHALGLEYISLAPRRTDTVWSAGVQASRRRQEELYAIYDHDEWQGYLSLKGYASPRLMLRGHAGVRTRTYAALPEESFIEPYGRLEARYFSPSRTTVGGSLRLGGKWFHDPVSARMWDTRSTPVTAQLAAALTLAQGVSDGVGLQASLEHRLSLADFPYHVSDEIHDNPLLDRYARAGWSAGGSVKVLAPRQVWLRLGASWREDRYGEILFDDLDGASHQRQDTVTEVWLAVERQFGLGGHRLTLKVHGAWTDQASTLALYQWSGPTAGAGLQWRW